MDQKQLVQQLFLRLREGGDWYYALISAALDEVKDLEEAIKMADEAYAQNPPPEEDVENKRQDL